MYIYIVNVWINKLFIYLFILTISWYPACTWAYLSINHIRILGHSRIFTNDRSYLQIAEPLFWLLFFFINRFIKPFLTSHYNTHKNARTFSRREEKSLDIYVTLCRISFRTYLDGTVGFLAQRFNGRYSVLISHLKRDYLQDNPNK